MPKRNKHYMLTEREVTKNSSVEGDFVLLNSDFVYDPIHTARQSRKLAQKALVGPFRI